MLHDPRDKPSAPTTQAVLRKYRVNVSRGATHNGVHWQEGSELQLSETDAKALGEAVELVQDRNP